jgi:homogentisate 1,2-dioxygenase
VKSGLGIHMYSCNTSMQKRIFTNSDGDFLFVPQDGALECMTEFGRIDLKPGEIMVIPRGFIDMHN